VAAKARRRVSAFAIIAILSCTFAAAAVVAVLVIRSLPTDTLARLATVETVAVIGLVLLGLARFALSRGRLSERRVERLYKRLVAQVPAAIGAYDATAERFIYVNQEYRDLYELTPDQVRGLDDAGWFERLHPDDRDQAVTSWRHACATGQPWRARYRWRRRDGGCVWISDTSTPIVGLEHVRLGASFDVTDQVTTQTRFEEIMASLPAAVAVFDPASDDLVYVSPFVEQLTGEPASYWLQPGRLAESRRRTNWDDVDQSDIDADPRIFTYRWTRPDGRVIWLRDHQTVLPNSDGLVQSLSFDVTEEVEAQRKYDEQRRHYQTLVEQLPVATFRTDPDGISLFYSPQIESIMGVPPDALIGLTASERERKFRNAGNPPESYEPFRRLYRGGQDAYDVQLNLRNQSTGRLHRVHMIARALNDQEGRRLGVQGVVVDITAEHEAATRLAEQQQRFKALVETMPVATIITDAHGDIQYLSPQITDISGYSVEEWSQGGQRERFERMCHPDDMWKFLERAGQLMAGVIDGYEVEARLRHRDGTWRSIVHRAVGITHADERREVHGVLLDVTELRDAERRSRDTLAALVNAAEAEQTPIATELHDDTVQVLTAALLRIRMAASQAPGQLKQVESLLEGALNRTRRLMFELRPQVLMHAGLPAALAELAREGPWHTADVDVDVPRYAPDVEALVYRTVRELVINARKHSNADRLTIIGTQYCDHLRVTVADDGKGFDAAVAFDRERKKLHLGLDTVFERMNLAGGHLALQTAPGEGTRYDLTLRATPREDSDVYAPKGMSSRVA
jgi:PAS domain S-box-containing protein